jgi:predicted metal-dependent TIM-barrel fold hydrolase
MMISHGPYGDSTYAPCEKKKERVQEKHKVLVLVHTPYQKKVNVTRKP